jgi:transposase-like protein
MSTITAKDGTTIYYKDWGNGPVVLAGPSLVTSVPTIDEVLHDHAAELGRDFVAYRNHAYRVVNLCAAIVQDRVDLEKVAVAAVFHELGIWTNQTFDCIASSVALAREYLAIHGRGAWIAEIERMIADHHKVTPSDANHDWLVEPFRRAVWIDVTRGLTTFGLPRPLVRSVLAGWPSAGFHWCLVQLTLERFGTHPQWAAISSVATKVGCTAETLRSWVRQAKRDAGRRPGLTMDERRRLKELERENRELRRANEILKKASAYFAQAESPSAGTGSSFEVEGCHRPPGTAETTSGFGSVGRVWMAADRSDPDVGSAR